MNMTKDRRRKHGEGYTANTFSLSAEASKMLLALAGRSEYANNSDVVETALRRLFMDACEKK